MILDQSWAGRNDHLPVSCLGKDLERSTGRSAYPLPKGEGGRITLSAFVLRELCLDPTRLTDDQLTEISLRFRTGKEYVSKEEAIGVSGKAAKWPITRAHFDNDIIHSPLLKMFHYGQAQNGN